MSNSGLAVDYSRPADMASLATATFTMQTKPHKQQYAQRLFLLIVLLQKISYESKPL